MIGCGPADCTGAAAATGAVLTTLTRLDEAAAAGCCSGCCGWAAGAAAGPSGCRLLGLAGAAPPCVYCPGATAAGCERAASSALLTFPCNNNSAADNLSNAPSDNNKTLLASKRWCPPETPA